MQQPKRNDQCPCMSGLKFKKCCDFNGVWQNFSPQGLTYIDESYYLSELLEDPSFNNLYISERGKINKDIMFFKADFDMKSSASYGHLGEEIYMIMTPFSKVPIDESIHVAHELIHLVLHSEGHKALEFVDEATKKVSRINKFLNDMIFDPLVNKRLILAGFDLAWYLKEADKVQLGTSHVGEGDLLLATLYVKRLYDYRNLKSNIQEDDIEFIRWLKKEHPQIVEKSLDMLNILEKYSLEQPDSSEAAFNELLSYLGLQNKMILKSI